MNNQNQRIQLNLHKYKTAGVQQFDIDKSSDEEFDDDDQSSLSSISEDDFSDSESGSYQDTTVSTTPSEATTDEMLWGR
ncbi:hypothetical protein B9Z55_023895 [Caenorhabditis nigoni]|nr:hypothetical protein B9Z55_023895 [Caenorhabditis nigoni]